MNLFFISTFSLLPLLALAAGGCPSGWLHSESNCYHFSIDTEAMPVAISVCKHFGADLVEIDSALENGFLTTQAAIHNNSFWIALTDLQEEGIWRWYKSNNELLTSPVTDWDAGQPDNRGEENCAYIQKTGHWADGRCYDFKNYICEKEDQ